MFELSVHLCYMAGLGFLPFDEVVDGTTLIVLGLSLSDEFVATMTTDRHFMCFRSHDETLSCPTVVSSPCCLSLHALSGATFCVHESFPLGAPPTTKQLVPIYDARNCSYAFSNLDNR